jgi:hypothetical protein
MISLLGVHRRIGIPVCQFFQLCVRGGPGIARLKARYDKLFLPTQFDRVALPAYSCFPMFHMVFNSFPIFLSFIELLFFHPFHQVQIS